MRTFFQENRRFTWAEQVHSSAAPGLFWGFAAAESPGRRQPAETYAATPKTSPLSARAAGGEPAPPRTARVNGYGVITYRRRKIGIGMHLCGRAVQVTEDRGIARIYHGHELVRELLLGPPGTYHGSGKPRGRPRKEPDARTTKI